MITLLQSVVSWPQADVAAARETVERARERLQRRYAALQDDPYRVAADLPDAALLGAGHPLLISPEVRHDALARAEVEDLRRVHELLFDARLATLIVAGSPTQDTRLALLAAVESAQGNRAAASVPRRRLPPAVPPGAAPVEVVDAGSAGQAQLVGVCLLPPFDAMDEWAFAAACHCLGGSPASRLSRRLRDALQATYGVSSRLTEAGHVGAPQRLVIRTLVAPQRAGACLADIRAMLADMAETVPVSPDELNAFRAEALQKLPTFRREPLEVVAALDRELRWGLPGSYWIERIERLHALSLEAVRHVARQHFRPERFRWSAAGAGTDLCMQLRAQGLPAVLRSPRPGGTDRDASASA